MKNPFCFLIVLLVVTTPIYAQIDKTFAEMGLSLELPIEKQGMEEHTLATNPQDLLPFLIAIELIMLDTAFELGEKNMNKIPKYLSSLHIMDIEPVIGKNGSNTKVSSYAFNASPKFENTFFPWLQVVEYETNTFHMEQQYTQGFGPRISI